MTKKRMRIPFNGQYYLIGAPPECKIIEADIEHACYGTDCVHEDIFEEKVIIGWLAREDKNGDDVLITPLVAYYPDHNKHVLYIEPNGRAYDPTVDLYRNESEWRAEMTQQYQEDVES